MMPVTSRGKVDAPHFVWLCNLRTFELGQGSEAHPFDKSTAWSIHVSELKWLAVLRPTLIWYLFEKCVYSILDSQD